MRYGRGGNGEIQLAYVGSETPCPKRTCVTTWRPSAPCLPGSALVWRSWDSGLSWHGSGCFYNNSAFLSTHRSGAVWILIVVWHSAHSRRRAGQRRIGMASHQTGSPTGSRRIRTLALVIPDRGNGAVSGIGGIGDGNLPGFRPSLRDDRIESKRGQRHGRFGEHGYCE